MHPIRVSFGVACLLIWAVGVMPGAAAQDISPPLYKTSTIIGRAVESQHGNEVGRIAEVIIESTSGDVAYAVLASDGVLGLGGKLFAIPWHTLQQSAGFGTFMLDVDKKTLQETPGFDRNRWPNRANTRWAG